MHYIDLPDSFHQDNDRVLLKIYNSLEPTEGSKKVDCCEKIEWIHVWPEENMQRKQIASGILNWQLKTIIALRIILLFRLAILS